MADHPCGVADHPCDLAERADAAQIVKNRLCHVAGCAEAAGNMRHEHAT